MEPEIAWTLTGVLLAMLGVAVTVIGFLWVRRNGKNGGNPNVVTIAMQFDQMIELQREGNQEVHEMHLTLAAMNEKVGLCPTVQQRERR